jgi:cyclic pyranopterin phosphate synthase
MKSLVFFRLFGTLTHIHAPPAAASASAAVPRLVDISRKPPAASRRATAEALVVVPLARGAAAAWRGAGAEAASRRAALFSTAVAAGVMGAKRTAGLIPMCHALALSACDIDVRDEEEAVAGAGAGAGASAGAGAGAGAGGAAGVVGASTATLRVTCTAETTGAATGVEMEALTGCAVAALTLYDMLKSASKGIAVERLRLLSKSGGAGGEWRADADAGAARGGGAVK